MSAREAFWHGELVPTATTQAVAAREGLEMRRRPQRGNVMAKKHAAKQTAVANHALAMTVANATAAAMMRAAARERDAGREGQMRARKGGGVAHLAHSVFYSTPDGSHRSSCWRS